MSNSTHRLRFNFWLNMEKPEEELIADKIEGLKNERSFSSVIRDGIRLICDLREGKLDVLFELFPWVKAEFMEYMRELGGETLPEQLIKADAQHIKSERVWLEAEQNRMEQERAWEQRRFDETQKVLEAERQAIEEERRRMEAERMANQTAIQKQLNRLEELLLSQGNQPLDRPAIQPASKSSPKQLNVPKFTTPTFDDDAEDSLLEVKQDVNAGKRATQNFLRSLMSLNESASQ